MNKTKFKINELTLGAMCVALSFVLSFIKFVVMPQSGSLTPASMLPIMIFCYIYGAKKGIIACIAYSLLQLLQDFYVVHWAQLFLDYILAFGSLALAGVFKNAKYKKINTIFFGIILAVLARYICHVASGIIFFYEYAGDQNVFIYSSVYNLYAPMEGLLCIIVMLIPQLNKFVLNKRIQARGDLNQNHA